MCSQSSINPTRKRNDAAPATTHPALVCGTSVKKVVITASQIATPPIIAVGRLCQRSVFGLATNPQRRASRRTTGVKAAASANDTSGTNKYDGLTGIINATKLAEKSYSIEGGKAS